MSRSAHAQSTYKLRKLPRCSRCSLEFNLVTTQYIGNKKIVEEWECPKCHKVVARELLKEDSPSEWEQFLHERCEELNGENTRTDGKNRC